MVDLKKNECFFFLDFEMRKKLNLLLNIFKKGSGGYMYVSCGK